MVALLGDLARLDGDDPVALADRRQAVGDDDHGAAMGDHPQVLLDDLLALGVERRGRLVEDQDPRIADQRAGDGDALALAARQVGAALLDDRVVAVRELEDELVRAGKLGRRDHRFHRPGRIGQRDILADRAVEQDILLKDDADLAPQPGGIDQREVDSVDQHPPLLRARRAAGPAWSASTCPSPRDRRCRASPRRRSSG